MAAGWLLGGLYWQTKVTGLVGCPLQGGFEVLGVCCLWAGFPEGFDPGGYVPFKAGACAASEP